MINFMENNKLKIDRRTFISKTAAAGAGFILAGNQLDILAKEKNTLTVPKRKLGKTGIEISTLGLGGEFNFLDNQIILRKAYDAGATFWDTAPFYGGGNSELGIGKFFERKPDARKNVLISTKGSRAKDIKDADRIFHKSLQRMKTDYVDLYCSVHGLGKIDQLTDDMKNWAKNAKAKGLIKAFGFSTHRNMAENLRRAAKLGWVDFVMTSYNFRLMQDDKINQAIEACHKAGVGVIAMKTQGHSPGKYIDANQELESKADKKVVEHFLKIGFNKGQAKIKAVLKNPAISCVCVACKNISILNSNIQAVKELSKLTDCDMNVLKEYALTTCRGYCIGCGRCEKIFPETPYITDTMRFLMYHDSYGETARAKELFAQIPADIKAKMTKINYRPAEETCPQNLPITQILAQATKRLS